MFLAAFSQGQCCPLQGLWSSLSELQQNPSPPSLALAASTSVAVSAGGTVLVLFLHFWALAGREEEGAGGNY